MSMHDRLSRRAFAEKAARTAVSLALAGSVTGRNVLGANDRIGVGLIGAGDQGRYDLQDFIRSDQVDVIAVADPHQHSPRAEQLALTTA